MTAASPPPSTHYWVIAPELGTNKVVAALRKSWYRSVQPERVHFCVANNTASMDTSLHRLPLRRLSQVPAGRDAFFVEGRLVSSNRREVYNSFLRRKVLAILREMAASAARADGPAFAMLLDADTAVNVSNVERLVAAIPLGGSRKVYTGRCLQAALDAPRDTAAAAYQRQDIAQFIAHRKWQRERGVPEIRWPLGTPPSPGGGPGIIFSRAMLAAVGPRLSHCEPLVEPDGMDRTSFSGGDSMITRCFAELGERCTNDADMGLDANGACPFPHGCALPGLFRKNPPWFYLAASRKIKSRTRYADPNSEPLGLQSPVEETVSYHHVRPTSRVSGMELDARCAVRLSVDPMTHAGWWGSECLPNFAIIGAPYSHGRSLLRTLLSHREVVSPERPHAHLFSRASVLELNLEDDPDGKASRAAWNGLLRKYMQSFPSINPRDFRLTGEQSPEYLYSRAALHFFSHPNAVLIRLVALLRQPAHRALDQLRRSAGGAAAVAAAHAALRRCGVHALYAACAACVRFANSTAAASARAPDCEPRSPALTAAVSTSALWHGWYHLFLPRWLALGPNRLRLVFVDELQRSDSSARLLSSLASFLQFAKAGNRAQLRLAGHLEPRAQPADAPVWDAPGPTARRHNASESTVVALRELFAHSVAQTDALLRERGSPAAVPKAWLGAHRHSHA